MARKLSPCLVLGEGTQPAPCLMAARWHLAPARPKRCCLEPGSRWQPSPSHTGSTGTSPSRAASSHPAETQPTCHPCRCSRLAGHGWVRHRTSPAARPSAPQPLLGHGVSLAPSPAPSQRAMSQCTPASLGTSPPLLRLPMGTAPCLPPGITAREGSRSGGMQPHREVRALLGGTQYHGDKPC